MKRILLSALITLSGAAAAHADCAQDFRAMMDAHFKAGRYHSESEIAFQNKTMKTKVDVVVPSSFHVLEGPTGGKNETIITADGAWDKLGDGKWTALSPEKHQMALKYFQSGLSSGFAGASNMTCLGQQDIEGRTLTAFSLDRVVVLGTQSLNDHIVIYRGDDGLPAIIVAERDSGKAKSHAVQHITYDPGIVIQKPE